MKRAAKLINLGAVRWFRAMVEDLPQGPSLRAACQQSQDDELAFFRSKVDLYLQKKRQETS